MKINYTGKIKELTEPQEKKLKARFAKLSKLLDSREERQAHIILKTERRLTKAEITVHYYGHEVVGAASAEESFTALNESLHKLETQILKLRKKWVDGKKRGTGKPNAAEPPEAKAAAPAGKKTEPSKKAAAKDPRVFRPVVAETAKPMDLEEAIFVMGKKDNYLLFRDARGGAVSLLVRRADGNFDLIET